VIPRQHQRDEKTDRERYDQRALRGVRPAETLGDDVEPLQERKSSGNVGDRPLHQLALFQALQKPVHRCPLPDVFAQCNAPRGCAAFGYRRATLIDAAGNSDVRFW